MPELVTTRGTTTLTVPAGQRWQLGAILCVDGELLVVDVVAFHHGVDVLTVHRATRRELAGARASRVLRWLRRRRPLWTYWPPWGD